MIAKESHYTLGLVKSEQDWKSYHTIRRTVLFEARGRNNYDENYGDESLPLHHPLLLKQDEKATGVIRLDLKENNSAIVRLVAIDKPQQHQGHGRVLDRKIIEYAKTLGINCLYLNAAPEALGYYKKMNWHEFMWSAQEQAANPDCTQMRKYI